MVHLGSNLTPGVRNPRLGKPAKVTRIAAIGAIFLMSQLAVSGPARAQGGAGPELDEPEFIQNMDENGVDLSTQEIKIPVGSLSVGSDIGRLDYNIWYRTGKGSKSEGYWDNFSAGVRVPGPGCTEGVYMVTLGASTEKFDWDSSSQAMEPDHERRGSILSFNSSASRYEYRLRDGTVAYYSATDRCSYGTLSNIIYPNGVSLQFNWSLIYSDPNYTSRSALASVSSNTGYQIRFTYGTNGIMDSAKAVNSAIDYCDPHSFSCSYSGEWPSIQMENNHSVSEAGNSNVYLTTWFHRKFTQSTGTYVKILYAANQLSKVERFGFSLQNIQLASQGRVSSLSDSYGTTSYTYNHASNDTGSCLNSVVRTNPDASVDTFYHRRNSGASRGLVCKHIDGISRTTIYQPLNEYMYEYTQRSEGNRESAGYDARGNVTETRLIAKPGSGLADIVTIATYPSTCGNPITCNKPTAMTDAKGQITELTYDPNHGGVLTETGPADLSGIRPQKRFEYAQRYAWVKNVSGGYVQAASPVWVLAKEEFCRTTSAAGAGCTGGSADEVAIEYDYGPNSGPNNLSLKGIAVTADGQTLRTCYGYDRFGRRVSETKPSANLSNCP